MICKGALHNYDPSQNCAKWVYLIYFYALAIGIFTWNRQSSSRPMMDTRPKSAPFTNFNKQNFAFSVPNNQYVNDSNFNPKAPWRTKCWHQGMCLMAKKQKQCSLSKWNTEIPVWHYRHKWLSMYRRITLWMSRLRPYKYQVLPSAAETAKKTYYRCQHAIQQ